MTWPLAYQAIIETRRDRARCQTCRRRVRAWVLQGLVDGPDPDSTSRRLCDRCALNHRSNLLPQPQVEVPA